MTKVIHYTDLTDDQLRRKVAEAAGFKVVPAFGNDDTVVIIRYPDGSTDPTSLIFASVAWKKITDLFVDMGYVWRLFDLDNGTLILRSDGETVEVRYADQRYGLHVLTAIGSTPERALMAAYLAWKESST